MLSRSMTWKSTVSVNKGVTFKLTHSLDQKMRVIIPVRGVNSNWDALLDQISAAENEFDEYLLSVKKQLK